MTVAPERDNLIYIGEEGWTERELRDAIEHPRCAQAHHPALTPSQITTLCERVRRLPRNQRGPSGYRRDHIAALAADVGVSTRTVLRYIRRRRCPGDGCLTHTIGGLLCQFCQRTAR
jgi:hypothetical protein